jgi:hypothetical protein
MSLGTVVLLVVMLMLVGILPMWQHASRWGIGSSVTVGTALAALVVLFMTGRL